MIYLSIALFLLIVLPVSIKEYQKDKGENISAKISNLIISLFLFQLYAGNIKENLYWFFDNKSEFKEDVLVQIGILTPFLSGLSWFLYLAMCFILTGLVILLVLRKEKYRIIFLRMLPFFYLIESANMYKYIVKSNEIGNTDLLIPILLFLVGIFAFLLYIFYSSNFVKRFFQI